MCQYFYNLINFLAPDLVNSQTRLNLASFDKFISETKYSYDLASDVKGISGRVKVEKCSTPTSL